jgi:hypothetical protein
MAEPILYRTACYKFPNGVIEGGHVEGIKPEVTWLHIELNNGEPITLLMNETETIAIVDILISGFMHYKLSKINKEKESDGSAEGNSEEG